LTDTRLWERDEASAAIASCLASARAGVGAAVFLVAEPGLGKTALLDEARRLAGSDVDVGLGRGEEMEWVLPFGLAERTLRPLAGVELELGAGHGEEIEPSAPYYRLLRWVQQRERPLLIALDDLHWSDSDSLSLFAFLVRRLSELPVAIIATLRPWPAAAEEVCTGLVEAGYARLERLAPLSRRGSDSLLADRVGGEVPEGTEQRAWELCQGNPLLLEQVARAIDRGEGVPEIGADGAVLRDHLVLARFAGLDRPSMLCARAASAIGTRFRPELAAEAARLPDESVDDAIAALYRSGLVVDAGAGETRFAHPLFADALYDDLAAPVRRRLHARLFTLFADRGLEIEACEHAIRAELLGDERAIEICERAGRASLAAGAVSTAVRHLEAALHLAGDRATPSLVLITAEALAVSGRMDESASTCERLLELDEIDWADRVEALRMLGRAQYLTGAPDRGEAAMEQAAAIAMEHDPPRAVQPLLDHSLSAWLSYGNARALPLAERAREIAAEGPNELAELAGAVWGHIAMESGDGAGLAATDAIGHRVDAGDERLFDPSELTWPWAAVHQYAMNATGAERYEDAERTWRRAREVAGNAGAANSLGTVGIWLANVLIRRGRPAEALEESLRAAAFGELTPGILPFAAAARAESLIWLGRLDESEAACREAEAGAPGNWFAELWVAYIRGTRFLWEGSAAAAEELRHAEEITLAAGIGEPCHIHWGAHGVSAHLAAGRIDEAQRVVDWHEACAQRLSCRWPRIVASLGAAQIAATRGEDELARQCFEASLVLHDEVELPLHRAEALLAYGGFLRRRGNNTEARPRLAAALAVAEACGAEGRAATAREELRLAGGRRRRATEDRDRLTPAELRVARLAAEGQSNAEIARSLQLSVNTIATHLKRVYSKLGIGSRRELMQLGAALTAREDA
jgi:ATP/maltotriose-dependent transcriptional regulator MalT